MRITRPGIVCEIPCPSRAAISPWKRDVSDLSGFPALCAERYHYFTGVRYSSRCIAPRDSIDPDPASCAPGVCARPHHRLLQHASCTRDPAGSDSPSSAGTACLRIGPPAPAAKTGYDKNRATARTIRSPSRAGAWSGPPGPCPPDGRTCGNGAFAADQAMYFDRTAILDFRSFAAAMASALTNRFLSRDAFSRPSSALWS